MKVVSTILSLLLSLPQLFVYINDSAWSEKFEKEIFSDPEFRESLEGRVEIVRKEEGEELLSLFDAEGSNITQVGYLPLSARQFADYLLRLFSDADEIKRGTARLESLSFEEIKGLYLKAKRVGKSQELFLEKGLKQDKGTFFLLEQYEGLLSLCRKNDPKLMALRKKISDLDPLNEQGAQKRLASLDFQKRAQRKQNPKSAIAPLVTYLEKFGQNDPDRWRVCMMIAQYLFTLDNPDSAFYAKQAMEAAPIELRPMIEENLKLFGGLPGDTLE